MGKRDYPFTQDSNRTGTTKVFDTRDLSDKHIKNEVFRYAQQLAGGKMPRQVIKNGKPLEGHFAVKLKDGTTINVRNFSSSTLPDKSQP